MIYNTYKYINASFDNQSINSLQTLLENMAVNKQIIFNGTVFITNNNTWHTVSGVLWNTANRYIGQFTLTDLNNGKVTLYYSLQNTWNSAVIS